MKYSRCFFNVVSFYVEVPAPAEPLWAHEVPRWHQLDEDTFAVVEAASQLRVEYPEIWQDLRPDSIFIAANGGSNRADFAFVKNGSRSPSRFVGTLPSIKSSSLALLMNWQGPIVCLVAGNYTPMVGLEEIYWNQQASAQTKAWMITTDTFGGDDEKIFKVSFAVFGGPENDAEFFLDQGELAADRPFGEFIVSDEECMQVGPGVVCRRISD